MAFDQTFSQYLNKTNSKEAEPRKKLRKRRSIRVLKGLLRLSSKSEIDSAHDDLPSKASRMQQASLVTASDSSTKSVNSASFNAKAGISREEIDFDDVNSMISSSRESPDMVVLRSTVMSDEAMPQLPSSLEVSDASPLFLKDSESSYDSSDGKSSNFAQSGSSFSDKKSLQTLSRSSSKRAVKILIKKGNFNPNKTPSKYSQKSEDLNVERATCSSIIKDSKFPEHVELEPGQTESERISFIKVCPYHHCSLNGHCHDPPLPKKPFLRRKRQSSEPQKAAKPSSSSGTGTKRSANKKKGSMKDQMATDAESSVREPTLLKFEDRNGRSDPEKDNQESHIPEKNSYRQEEDISEATSELKEVEKPNDPNHSFQLQKTDFGKGKPISMWHLIHKHMASSLAADEEHKPLQGADERRQAEEAAMANARKSSDVSPDFSDSDFGTSIPDKESQDIEIRKLFAIKLVREAIEKILLPEVQDQQSENQSITSDSVEGQDLPEKNHQQANNEGFHGENANVQVYDDDNINAEEKKKAETKLGKKTAKKSPSNWSNLKKWVLLHRFVKELEKVRKLNYKKPQTLQLKNDPQEKVSLRHQTVDEKKRAEEWMLDYALQQVVSQLAPTQRRKVTLLVKAFETVVPPQEDGAIGVTSKANASVAQEEERKLKAQDKTTSNPDDIKSSVREEHCEADSQNLPVDSSQTKINVEGLSGFKSEVSSGGSESYSRSEEINAAGEQSYTIQTRTCDVEANSEAGWEIVPASDEIIADHSSRKSEPRQILISNSELSSGDSAPTNNRMELGDFSHKVDESLNTSPILMAGKTENTANAENLVYSTLDQESSTWKETRNESMPEVVSVQLPSRLDTKLSYKENGAAPSPLDKQQYIGMWHLVCQHVVSSVATKLGSQLLEEEDEETEDASKSSVMGTSGPSKDPLTGSRDVINENAEFSRSQVLKLVKEAVQEILSPEIQDDSSDTLSVSSEIPPDPELLGIDHSEGAKQSMPNSVGVTEPNTIEFHQSKDVSSMDEEKGPATDVITTEDSKKLESLDTHISDPPKPKNWSKLKKLVLLKRSIKAMEKARKLKYPPPQQLPAPLDRAPEKVDLRHQMMDERRKAEKWMLDYAVQHIVTTLTPARKRRVAMLVEAFEAVVPLPEI